MPKNIIQYSLLISCPGDIKEEIDSVEECVSKFNTLYTDALGIEIVTKHWRKNSYPQSGGKPQSLLNKQFVNDCDAAVAILWTKFGTPTDEYGSGTEEEVEIMLASEKQVFMYFSDKPLSPSQLNSDEYQKVLAFRKKYKDKGLYFSYTTSEEFKSMFFAHLSQHFLSEKRVSEIENDRHSVLKLVGIDDNLLINEDAYIVDFIPNTEVTSEEYCEKIKSLIQNISAIKLEKKTVYLDSRAASLNLMFNKPAELDDNIRKTIQSIAEAMSIDIPEDFFNLGNLTENTISTSSMFGGKDLQGTNREKEKYRTIQDLYETIIKLYDWMPIENAFSKMKCIRLALQNCGTAVDEDVEISIKFPRNSILSLQEFPSFNNEEQGYLLNDCDMKALFGISSTPEYADYDSSIVNKSFAPQIHSSSLFPRINPDYSNDYLCELSDVFCYNFFDTEDACIIKLKIEYIKHHTTIAFPTILFVKNAVTIADYSITSKNAPDVINGKIEFLG